MELGVRREEERSGRGARPWVCSGSKGAGGARADVSQLSSVAPDGYRGGNPGEPDFFRPGGGIHTDSMLPPPPKLHLAIRKNACFAGGPVVVSPFLT